MTNPTEQTRTTRRNNSAAPGSRQQAPNNRQRRKNTEKRYDVDVYMEKNDEELINLHEKIENFMKEQEKFNALITRKDEHVRATFGNSLSTLEKKVCNIREDLDKMNGGADFGELKRKLEEVGRIVTPEALERVFHKYYEERLEEQEKGFSEQAQTDGKTVTHISAVRLEARGGYRTLEAAKNDPTMRLRVIK